MAVSFDWRIAPLLVVLLACSPALDWRDVRVDGAGLAGLFPCRPERRARSVPVAGANVRMEMVACAAGGSTFAASFVDLEDPATVTAALEALRGTAVANLGAVAPRQLPFALGGMTPNAASARLVIAGRLPDGTPVQEHAAFFVRGLRVYQASVIGREPSRDAVEAFLGGLKFAS
ncbi:MAG TPA: hypothetical protein VF319_07150 [Caldimonas sp.]